MVCKPLGKEATWPRKPVRVPAYTVAFRGYFNFLAYFTMTTRVIRLPELREDLISTHESGFLDALDTDDITLHSQHMITDNITIVFMTTATPGENFIAIKMNEDVEPTDLTLDEFTGIFPHGSWSCMITHL